MRIATWNINGLRARLEFVLHWLEARQPDVVGLQELKLTDEQFPHEALNNIGYRAVTHGQKAWNGVAVVSRKEAKVMERGLPGEEDFGARLITAEVADLTFTTVYCPNGKNLEHVDYARKLTWFDRLAALLESELDPSSPAVLCGDFNICPMDLDSWGGKSFRDGIFHTQAERERMQQLLDLGLVDLFRHQFPDKQAYTWWDYRGGAFHRKQGLRIDFLLATPPLVKRLVQVEIDREYRKKIDGMTASDHAPVWADLE